MPLFICFWQQILRYIRQHLDNFLGTNHPTLSRNTMLITGENSLAISGRLISRTCPLGFLRLANHLLVTAWKSTTSQFQSHPPVLRATVRALTRSCNWWELKGTLRYFSVKRLSGKSYRCHITFQCCEFCNHVRCSFSVKYSRVRSMAPEQHLQMAHLFCMGGIK